MQKIKTLKTNTGIAKFIFFRIDTKVRSVCIGSVHQYSDVYLHDGILHDSHHCLRILLQVVLEIRTVYCVNSKLIEVYQA